MITAKCYNGFACDVWSVGCILLELVLGREAFTSMWMCSYALDVLTNQASFQNEIQSRSMDIHAKIHENDAMGCSDLLHGLLAIDPQKRWSMAHLRSHEWLQINKYEANQNIAFNDLLLLSTKSAASITTTVSLQSNSSDDEDDIVIVSSCMDELTSYEPEKEKSEKSEKSELSVNKGESTSHGKVQGKEQELKEQELTRTNTSPAPLGPIKIGSSRPRSAGSSALLVSSSGSKNNTFSSLAARRSKKINLVMTDFSNDRGAASPATMKERAGQLHLPPISSPDTPKIRSVRKILDNGTAIVRQLGMEAESPLRSSSPPINTGTSK